MHPTNAAPSPPFQVVVMGNVGVDTNVYLAGDAIDFTVEANFTDNVDYVGQAGGFAARGYAALGKRTALIGHVGADHNGELVRRTLADDGINVDGLGIDPAGTARSVNIMYRDGRRKNFYDGKGHMTLEPEMGLCIRLLAGARLVHVNLPNWGRGLLRPARRTGAVVACDLQDVVDPDDPYRRDFIEQADILFFSATNHADPRPLMARWLAARPHQVIVAGMGAEGCAVANRDGFHRMPPVDLPDPVVDTNGAGDSLAVGFLSAYVLDGKGLLESVLRGQIAARHACTLRADSGRLIRPGQMEEAVRRLRPQSADGPRAW